MKRRDNLFLSNLTYSNLYNSYLKCKKGKSFRDDVILFSLNYEYYLNLLLYELKNNIFKFNDYYEFYIYEPKKRRVLSACFRDRIVHTFLCNYILNDIFIPSFINTTYACIKGRGMHKCSYDTFYSLKKFYKLYPYGYIFKFDISKFFDNIDKNILFDILKCKIKDKYVLNLLKLLLDSTNDYYDNINISIPIGNLTSQLFR